MLDAPGDSVLILGRTLLCHDPARSVTLLGWVNEQHWVCGTQVGVRGGRKGTGSRIALGGMALVSG